MSNFDVKELSLDDAKALKHKLDKHIEREVSRKKRFDALVNSLKFESDYDTVLEIRGNMKDPYFKRSAGVTLIVNGYHITFGDLNVIKELSKAFEDVVEFCEAGQLF